MIEKDSEVELHSASVSQSTAYSVISEDTTQDCFAAAGGGWVGLDGWITLSMEKYLENWKLLSHEGKTMACSSKEDFDKG